MPYPQEMAVMPELIVDDPVMDTEQLLLAVYYASELVPDEECVLEIMRDFGGNDVNRNQEIFQIQFDTAANLPLAAGQYVRLLLSSAVEARVALRENWAQIQDLRRAIAAGQYTVMYTRPSDAEAHELAELLCLRQEVAA